MRTVLVAVVLFLLVAGRGAWGQAGYVGSVGTLPIELALDQYSGGETNGVYLYTRFGTPIALRGTTTKGVLRLVESDRRGQATACILIPAFATDQQTVAGTWQNLVTGQKLPLALRQQFGPGSNQDSTASRELLQVAALKTCYFKTVMNGSAGISSVRLYEKKTGRLVQELEGDGAPRALRSVSVGDFNFDGLEDFAVFEQSFAGPNTASQYFLYDPIKKRYVDSGFEGVSLQFDPKTRRVYETNSCCAGSSIQNSTYKIVHNRMVLVEQHCLRWNEKKQALVERKLSECQ